MKYYYYADKKTINFLLSNKKRVYLYGSYGGYNNFGDIIQLKSMVWFHKKRTRLEPVIFFHASSLESPNHVGSFNRWLDCENLVFISDTEVNASSAGLYPVREISLSGILHIYGGGFLNRLWGKGMLDKIKDIIKVFEPKEYFFSGQQIDKTVIPGLDQLFNKKRPMLFGARDMETLNLIQSTSIDESLTAFSFDDVIEVFDAWYDSSKASLRLRATDAFRPKSIMLHMNLSSYADSNKGYVLSKIKRIKRKYPHHRALVAHIYNDIRLSLRDSLQSIVQLENSFPYIDYKVANFAQMALEMKPEKNKYPNLSGIMSSVDFAVASSYHITMLAHFFRIPAFLISSNKYYSQKQKGLGLNGDFSKFLSSPRINLKSYEEERRMRKEWLKIIEEKINDTVPSLESRAVKYIQGDFDYLKVPEIKYRSIHS